MRHIDHSRFDVYSIIAVQSIRVVEYFIRYQDVKTKYNRPHRFDLLQHYCIVVIVELFFLLSVHKHRHIVPAEVNQFIII
jgi:hypothetical protein